MSTEHMTEEQYIIEHATSPDLYWSEEGWTQKHNASSFHWHELPLSLDGVGGLWIYHEPGCNPVDAQYQEGCDDRGEPICVAHVVEL